MAIPARTISSSSLRFGNRRKSFPETVRPLLTKPIPYMHSNDDLDVNETDLETWEPDSPLDDVSLSELPLHSLTVADQQEVEKPTGSQIPRTNSSSSLDTQPDRDGAFGFSPSRLPSPTTSAGTLPTPPHSPPASLPLNLSLGDAKQAYPNRPAGLPPRPLPRPDVPFAGRRHGVCKWFDAQRGYGFIMDLGLIAPYSEYSRQPLEVDVFVHYSAIQGNKNDLPSNEEVASVAPRYKGGEVKAFKSIAENEKVEYEVVIHNQKGYAACNLSGPGGSRLRGDPKMRGRVIVHDSQTRHDFISRPRFLHARSRPRASRTATPQSPQSVSTCLSDKTVRASPLSNHLNQRFLSQPSPSFPTSAMAPARRPSLPPTHLHMHYSSPSCRPYHPSYVSSPAWDPTSIPMLSGSIEASPIQPPLGLPPHGSYNFVPIPSPVMPGYHFPHA